MDYFSREQILPPDQDAILSNFSDDCVNEVGLDKNSFFLYGNLSTVTLSGNKLSGTDLYINTGYGAFAVSNTSVFKSRYPLSGDNVSLVLGGIYYNFTFHQGENFYYLIQYPDGSQSFVFSG
jgi:hypothetical protein